MNIISLHISSVTSQTTSNTFVRLLLLFLLASLAGLTVNAQVTKINGMVRDSLTREGIPFVNIVVPGTTIGTLTDFEGNYALEFRHKADSITAFLIGFRRVSHTIRHGQYQVIDFALLPQNLDLPEVVITYQGNPADVIMKKVVAGKERNSLRSSGNYRYDAYTKIQFDANNLGENFRNSFIFKDFKFIWERLDTSTLTGKSYLPVMLIETASEVFFRQSPRVKKEIIRGSVMSGIRNSSVSQFFGNLYEQVDIYRNYIPLFQKTFVGPAADFSSSFYKYYLVDSAFIGKHWCYHLMFKPRRPQELTFTGNFWIADTSFAIKQFFLRIASDANMNFVNDLTIEQEFEWTGDRFWMLTRDKLEADFNIIEDSKLTFGFYGHKTNIYRNFRFDVPEDPEFFRSPVDLILTDSATLRTQEYWERIRPEPLTVQEQGIYDMVDSVKKVPAYRTYKDLAYAAFTGYVKWNYLEFGPWYNVYSANGTEGSRFRIGARTSNKFSTKLQLQGYFAYGTRDQTLKYSADVIWMLSKNPRRDITSAVKFDVEQLGAGATAMPADNILSSMFVRGPNNKLTLVRDYRVAYEHEWYTGLINTVHLIHRQQFPLGNTEFIIFPSDTASPVLMNSIFTSEVRFDSRWSFRERFVAAEFTRVTISSEYPIITLSYIYGAPNLFRSDFEYHKLILNASQWFNFATIGWSKYVLEAGKVWGTLPYPLLRIHDGNQTFFYDGSSANLMNYYEFISDTWVSLYYTHHFNGLLFNKIPLLRKLKWREVVHFKGVYGTLQEKNARFSKFPGALRPFGREPYYEAGAGIENIFKVFRIDAVWRLSHLNDPGNSKVSKFSIFGSLFFSF